MKKALSLSMALAMSAAMLAGCGGSASDSTSASDAASSADSAASGTPTVSFMIPDFTGHVLSNEHSDEVIAKYEAYTGTHVEWRTEANDTYSEKFGLTLMDKDNMPMILTATKTLDQNANAADAAKRGAFWDLTEYLQDSEAYPNLSQISPDVLKGLTVDGQIIGIPRSRAIGRNGLGYRTDWAEAVGITEAPKTVEDVYDMLYKFTYDDPDGNGANDTYGLEMCKYTGPWDIIQTWFGCGNGWVEQDGKLVPVHQTAEYKEALDWMRKIYADGLVRPDWATVDTANFQVDSQKGVTGVFVDTMDGTKRIWKYFEDNAIADVNDASKIATMTSVGPINGHTLATTGYNGFYLITKSGAKTEEDVKACLHFLDKMCDPEMMALADYGLKDICYDINEIAMSSQSRLIQQKQAEQAYKRLMTSLSHDVKTPLASLVGYLEAVESKMVTGAEQEEYIRVAMEKAHHLKDFVTALFEWVKLDAGEQIFHFEVCDLNELSRNIMADWVPLLENHNLSYEIEIPETEYMTRVDPTAYTRILNNLLQNILTHSAAIKVFLTVTETEQQAKIVVADNGNGIAASDLPHIFERMYQCDHSRSAKGNGLGLSIAKELVSVHKGTITAASVPGAGTTFTIILPKAL